MTYILLIHVEEVAQPRDVHRPTLEESVAICHELNARGQYFGTGPLHPLEMATCVRVNRPQLDQRWMIGHIIEEVSSAEMQRCYTELLSNAECSEDAYAGMSN